jgi:hypothetical protein
LKNKGNKMLLRDAVTTIAFRDADLNLLMDALRAYRNTVSDLDANTVALLASVMDNIRTAVND